MSLLGDYRGLPRSIYVLFLAHVVNSFGNFVWPFLTLFLTDRLGMNAAQAGLFVTLAGLAQVPGSLLGGKLADTWGRKNLYLISRTLAALTLVPCAFLGTSRALPWLLVAGSLIGGATGPAVNAMVADLAPRPQRQPAFSLLYLGHNVGFMVGPMLAGLLYRHHLPWLFLGDALTSLASVLLLTFLVPETLPRAVEGGDGGVLPEAERPDRGGVAGALLRRPELLAFALILLVYNLVYVQYSFSLPLQVRDLFGSAGPAFYGLLMSLAGITVVVMTPVITRLTASLSHPTSIALGGLCFAAGFGMIGLIRAPGWFYGSTVLWTLGEIAMATRSRAFIADHAPVTHRGRFNAALDLVSHLGFAAGPPLAGLWIRQAGVGMVWPVCFLLATPAAAAMFVLGRASGRPGGETQNTIAAVPD